jgi:hypothetical protein
MRGREVLRQLGGAGRISLASSFGALRINMKKEIRCSYCGNYNPHAYKGSCPKCTESNQIPKRMPKTDYMRGYEDGYRDGQRGNWS